MGKQATCTIQSTVASQQAIMGKLDPKHERSRKHHSPNCNDECAPICDCDQRHTVYDWGPNDASKNNRIIDGVASKGEDIKELLVIGAGPHALTLLLRLLEPEADFLSEGERHLRAENVRRLRPLCEVYNHIKRLSRGPSVTLKRRKNKKKGNAADVHKEADQPPLALEDVRKSVVVVDAFGGWLTGWKQNFKALQISRLRSPTNAHADPFDHRSLEIYAEKHGRGDELVSLPHLLRSPDFRGPFQAPSTALFQDFHDLLTQAYGIDDVVLAGTVQSIIPERYDVQSDEPVFHVEIATTCSDTNTPNLQPFVKFKARRVVCAMGPIFQTGEAFWEASLRVSGGENTYPSDRILHAHEIVPWIMAENERQRKRQGQAGISTATTTGRKRLRLLIVGGGITSVHLALLAANQDKSPWCQSVTIIQRSNMLERQFDIENKWMGPQRGKLLNHFRSLDMHGRANLLKEARRGGSVPPEIIQDLRYQEQTNPNLRVKEEIEIAQVDWKDGCFKVALDDGSPCEEYDMIWLATGGDSDINLCPVLSNLNEELPIDVVNGLPVLNQDLSWRCSQLESNQLPPEPQWKQTARKRFWVMGALAGLELGPDALNLVGGRHGAIRVARAIRASMSETTK